MKYKGMLVGLTGQSGAGKTLVSSFLTNRGYHVIDADLVARQVVAKGAKCTLDLAVEFGIEILNADGTLNRQRLGSMVFGDKKKRMKLNKITFPYIQEEIFGQVDALRQKGERVIFLDAPTLFESKTHRKCDKVVSVTAPLPMRLERVMKRDGVSREDAMLRFKAQREDDFYIAHSDFVIENSGDINQLKDKMHLMLDSILPKED